MAIREEAKCRCEVPEPRGISDCLGAIQCGKCKKVANWRDLENEETGLQAQPPGLPQDDD